MNEPPEVCPHCGGPTGDLVEPGREPLAGLFTVPGVAGMVFHRRCGHDVTAEPGECRCPTCNLAAADNG